MSQAKRNACSPAAALVLQQPAGRACVRRRVTVPWAAADASGRLAQAINGEFREAMRGVTRLAHLALEPVQASGSWPRAAAARPQTPAAATATGRRHAVGCRGLPAPAQ